ncbi:MAG TPA: tRNA (adenosine(37)-N6)-threonylcarbamoyltransferase complex ATPase subunit type 1 TsaE [Gammaproteobacteria bacterium]|nr:tRNA (adenosine(37)-N6)-threonylcarbamoyltransferase complex ATPase subunit type 1 TsaE [Gammaproteobacteria bacterium]
MVIRSARAMESLGRRLAAVTAPGAVIFLQGELGAGKTTLVRGFLRALGVISAVKSPTYTLVEPYSTAAGPVMHVDLYRLKDPRELEYSGLRDHFNGETICLIEWPERGEGVLPVPDLRIGIDKQLGNTRALTLGAETIGGARSYAEFVSADKVKNT